MCVLGCVGGVSHFRVVVVCRDLSPTFHNFFFDFLFVWDPLSRTTHSRVFFFSRIFMYLYTSDRTLDTLALYAHCLIPSALLGCQSEIFLFFLIFFLGLRSGHKVIRNNGSTQCPSTSVVPLWITSSIIFFLCVYFYEFSAYYTPSARGGTSLRASGRATAVFFFGLVLN